jgi:predicted HTH transcriptional regulator
LEELRRSLLNRSFDQLACPDTDPDDLDRDKIAQAFAPTSRIIDDRGLESLGVLVPQSGGLVPSNGGVILFGRDGVRERVFPDARVSCARFRGADKSEFLDRLDVDGSVLEALAEAPRFIRRNTRLAAKIEGMRRQDVSEYPEVALREVLVNAVAHADYSLTGMRILVAVYSDRLEVQNPGMLPFGMTLEDLKAGVSRVRNRVIARVMRELGLVEEWGSGYRRIAEACRTGEYPVPEWQELGAVVRVVLWPHPLVGRGGQSTPATESGRDQVGTKSGPSRDQVRLLEFSRQERSIGELMHFSGWQHRTKFRAKFLRPLLEAGWVAMTIPDKPTSSRQRYVITQSGLRVLAQSPPRAQEAEA